MKSPDSAWSARIPARRIFKPLLALGIVLATLLTPFHVVARGGSDFNPDRILVKPLAGRDLSPLHRLLGVRVRGHFRGVGDLQILEVPATTTADALIDLYQRAGLVQYAEHDYLLHALNEPNDYYYQLGNLWNFKNVGQFGGTPGADIHAWLAWNVATDASSVIVAVVDTGVRYTHEDLAANMWVNTDGTHGINVLAGNNDPWDDYGHGSHVSGTIGAVGNNSVGVVGVCWNTRIMACKFLDSTGKGTVAGAVACIDFARTNGAKVINASWGSYAFTSQALHDAIASARDADIIFVAAAGNSGTDNDVEPLYPASYSDLDNVVAVAATDLNDLLPSWSDYGPTNVALAAPGTPIYSCWNGSDSDYEYDSGTSMACAHVTGACALLRAVYPDDTHLQTIQRLLSGVDPLPSLAGKILTGGRLDLAKSIGASFPPPLTAGFTANPASGMAPLAAVFTDTSTGGPTSWRWNFGDGTTSTAENPAHTFKTAGKFTVALAAGNDLGQTSTASATISVTNAPTLTASFTASPSSGPVPLTVHFTDTSTGNPAAWNWNFGDGSGSTTQNPSHVYSKAGKFKATLTVTASNGRRSTASHNISVSRSR